MSEPHPLEQTASFILSPLGGVLAALLLKPVQCLERGGSLLKACAADQQADFFGWTLGGRVAGMTDDAVIIISLGTAAFLFLTVHTFFAARR